MVRHKSTCIHVFLFLQIGTWHSNTGVNITEDVKENRKKISDHLANKTLIVTTVLVSTTHVHTLTRVHTSTRVNTYSYLHTYGRI